MVVNKKKTAKKLGRKKSIKRINKRKSRAVVLYTWTDEQRTFIIERLGTYRSKPVVYKELTDPDFKKVHGFKGLDMDVQTYTQFRQQCSTIKATEIETAHQKWVEDFQGIPFSTRKGRVEAMSTLIDLLQEKDATSRLGIYYLPDVVSDIRMLLREIRVEMDAEAEREAKAAAGTNIYMGDNLLGMQITPELIADSIAALFGEFGIDMFSFQHWSLKNLLEIKTYINKCINSKQTKQAEFTVIDDKE